jgi:hypothetical protein
MGFGSDKGHCDKQHPLEIAPKTTGTTKFPTSIFYTGCNEQVFFVCE